MAVGELHQDGKEEGSVIGWVKGDHLMVYGSCFMSKKSFSFLFFLIYFFLYGVFSFIFLWPGNVDGLAEVYSR